MKYRENEDIRIEPVLVCTVKYMKNTKGLRQAVFKGLRGDKEAKEIILK